MLHRIVFLIIAGCSFAHAQSRQGQALFEDDFTQDRGIDTRRWQVNPPSIETLAHTMFPKATARLVFADPSFSAAGLRIAGAGDFRQMVGIESTQSFTPPYTVQADVIGERAFGVPFALMLVPEASDRFLGIFGNLNPQNGDAYKLGAWRSGQPIKTLIATPAEGIWYRLTLIVTADGKATAEVADRGGNVTKLDGFTLGSEPMHIVLLQVEMTPRMGPGPNIATWRNVSVAPGTSADTLALNRRPLPPDRAPVLHGTVLPPPQDGPSPLAPNAPRPIVPTSSPSPDNSGRPVLPGYPRAPDTGKPVTAGSGKITATFTGKVDFMNDDLSLFGGGRPDYRNSHDGPDVTLVFTWNDTGEPLGSICKPYRGLSSMTPPSATESVVLTVGDYSYNFGQLPNLHADMERFTQGVDQPHVSEFNIYLREGGRSIDSRVVPNTGSFTDIHIGMDDGRIHGSCDWRESLSMPLRYESSDIIVGQRKRRNTEVEVVYSKLVIDGPYPAGGGNSGATSSRERRSNPIIGVWRNMSDNAFMRVPNIEFTPTQEIDDGQRFNVTYDVQGNTVYVNDPRSFSPKCVITGPDRMTCTQPIVGTVDLARVR
jgi:hypothetical protein